MVIASTMAIAIVPTFARFAYEGGSNTFSVITARSLFTVVLTWLVMVATGQSIRIGRKPLLLSIGTGLCYALMLYGFLGAVEFLPVNTVILIYFMQPLLVGIVSAWLGDEAISPGMIVALAAACVGLGLAVGFSVDRLSLPGLLLAGLATLTCVGVIIGNGRAVKHASGLAVVFYMMGSAATALALLFSMFGSWASPTTVMGWLGFAGVAAGSTVGTLAFFCAVPILGAVRATMISNLEPILGIMFAVLILQEHVSLVQWTGIAIVLAAILFMEWMRAGQARSPGSMENPDGARYASETAQP
jgi:drug/metabolite transporter (DMT)-like permease